MKKIFTLLFVASLYLQSNGQTVTVQASIGRGIPVNQIIIYMKSDIAHTGVISTVQFNVGVEAATLVTVPTLTVVNSFIPGVTTWTVSPPYLEGGYWNYNIYTIDNVAPNMLAGVEFPVMELAFGGGNPILGNVALVTLQDGGGITGNALFLVNGGTLLNPVQSNGLGQLYYFKTGTILQNQNSYDQASVGTPLTGTSFVLLTNVTLPVKFNGFNVIKKDNGAVLNWLVENETSLTDRYEIERSLNGIEFKTISTIAPKNNGRSANNYTATDADLSAIHSGVIYYRIKQTDKDGQFVYTEIKSVRLDAKAFSASVYPNPVRSKANLSIDLIENSPVTITLNDGNGKVLKNMQIQGIKGVNKKEIDMSSLSRGNYLLRIQTATETTTLNIIKGNN